MQLQTVRSNIVQAIRAYRVDELMEAAQAAGQHFLYANTAKADGKPEVLEAIAQGFTFPEHFGKNLDALYDCLTDLVHKAGPQPGFVVVLEQLPDNPRFDREEREKLLDVFRDAADFWADRRIPFRCFYSFSVAHTTDAKVVADGDAAQATAASNGAAQPNGQPIQAEGIVTPPKPAPKPAAKAASKNGVNPNFGMNMPMMVSAFDTAAWLNAA